MNNNKKNINLFFPSLINFTHDYLTPSNVSIANYIFLDLGSLTY